MYNAVQVSYPVRLLWSREQDTQHDYYRSAELCRVKAILEKDGTPRVWMNTDTDIGINDDVAAAFIPFKIPHQPLRQNMQQTQLCKHTQA